MIKCVNCSFISEESLIQKHMDQCKAKTRFQASQPPRTLTNVKKEVFKCTECDFEAPYGFLLNAHFFMDHQINTLNRCPYCDVSNIGSYVLDSHIRKVHNINLLFTCMCCEYSCIKEQTLYSHVLTKHSSILKYKCSVCVAQFDSVLDVVSHVSSVHGGVSNIIQSEYGKRGLNTNAMTSAIQSNTDSARFQDNNSVNEKTSSANHKNTSDTIQPKNDEPIKSEKPSRQTDPQTSSKRSVCARCGSGFDDDNALLKHLTASHSNHYYTCPVCLLVYLDETNLHNHFLAMHNAPDAPSLPEEDLKKGLNDNPVTPPASSPFDKSTEQKVSKDDSNVSKAAPASKKITGSSETPSCPPATSHTEPAQLMEYKCSFCDFTCFGQSDIEHHLEMAHSYVCETNSVSPNKNVATVDKEPILFLCSQCPLTFQCKIEVEDHVKTAHSCSLKTPLQTNLDSNINEALSAPKKPTAPPEQPSTTVEDQLPPEEDNSVKRVQEEVEGIQLTKDQPSEILHHCLFCDFTHPSKDMIESHTVLDHEPKLPFTCYFCSMKFATRVALDAHVTTDHHVTSMFPCFLCSYSSPIKDNVKAHLEEKHGFLL